MILLRSNATGKPGLKASTIKDIRQMINVLPQEATLYDDLLAMYDSLTVTLDLVNKATSLLAAAPGRALPTIIDPTGFWRADELLRTATEIVNELATIQLAWRLHKANMLHMSPGVLALYTSAGLLYRPERDRLDPSSIKDLQREDSEVVEAIAQDVEQAFEEFDIDPPDDAEDHG